MGLTLPSSAGSSSIFLLGMVYQFRPDDGAMPENDDDDDDDAEKPSPCPPISFLKLPRPRFIDMVDRCIVIPMGAYALTSISVLRSNRTEAPTPNTALQTVLNFMATWDSLLKAGDDGDDGIGVVYSARAESALLYAAHSLGWTFLRE
jgi:hypothetical protein